MGASRFTAAYVGWLGLQWQLLEEVDRCCERGVVSNDRLLRCKLECHLLEEALARLVGSGQLRVDERVQVQGLLGDMRSLLALGHTHAVDLLQKRVHAAQNRLYDEVCAVTQAGRQDSSIGHAAG